MWEETSEDTYTFIPYKDRVPSDEWEWEDDYIIYNRPEIQDLPY